MAVLNIVAKTDPEFARQLLRAQYSEVVADALYKAKHLSCHASLGDARPDEAISAYREIAEAAVMLACDEAVCRAAEYYAADCVQAERGHTPLAALPPGQRVHRVREWRSGLHGWLRMLRGMYPMGIGTYQQLADQDHAQMIANRTARETGEAS